MEHERLRASRIPQAGLMKKRAGILSARQY
jgi:hypothetical protein